MTNNQPQDQVLEQFLEYLDGVLHLYKDMVPILESEIDAIMRDDIDYLNKSLKSQQALVLKIESFDKQLAYFLSLLGIKAVNLTEMAQQLPEEDGAKFFNLLREYEPVMTKVVHYKDKCTMLLNTKLYMIEKTLSKLMTLKEHITYDQNAAEVQNTMLSKSFELKV
jgi:hypothetical protein